MFREILVALVAASVVVAGGVQTTSQFTRLPSVCEQMGDQHKTEQGITCKEATQQIVKRARENPVFKQAAKTLILGQAAMVEKEGAPFRMLVIPARPKAARGALPVVPLDAKGRAQELNLLMVYLEQNSDQIKRVVLLHTHTDDKGMEVSFRTGDGQMIGGAIYREGKVVNTLATAQGVSTSNYWSCWQNCLEDQWDKMPGWIQWACQGSCGACIFGGKLWTCPMCALCVGFWGGWCDAECRR